MRTARAGGNDSEERKSMTVNRSSMQMATAGLLGCGETLQAYMAIPTQGLLIMERLIILISHILDILPTERLTPLISHHRDILPKGLILGMPLIRISRLERFN